MNKKLNGFNDGLHASSGVGGGKPYYVDDISYMANKMNENKIIFLDIDGVLNSSKSAEYYHNKYGGNGFGGFFREDDEPTLENVLWDEDCVELLNDIIKETNAKIVISSTWRKYYSLDAFKKMFKLYGVENLDIIGRTKLGTRHRGEEIQAYIDEHKITKYVILDDDSDMLESQILNFVNTNCDFGLSESDSLKAIEILNK